MKIIQRLKKWLHKEHGALIIESAFVYPIMFFVLMFLLYMGNMYYLKAKINSVVSQEAITYAARFADPNQEQFDKTIPTSNQGDTQVTKELYRYLDVFNLSDYGTASDVQKNELVKEIEDTGFYAGMTPANITVETHKVHNYVVYQTYEVTVNYQLKFPIRFIFSKDVVLLNMTAHEETPVIDTSEFIRNVDMAVDYVERTETGQSILTTLDNTYARIEKFIDGEKKPDPSEAVAGGSGTYTVTDLDAAISDKCKEYYDKYGPNLTAEQKQSLYEELLDLYKKTAPQNRGDLLVPMNAEVIDGLQKSNYGKGDLYIVTYKWETGNETEESTRTMKTMPVGTVFDRLGSPYGKCVGQVNEDGSCAKVSQRSIPYYFEGDDATQQASYHRYVVKVEITKSNLIEQIEKKASSVSEKERMKAAVNKYYDNKIPVYGNNGNQDGLAYGEIASMFGEPGGGYQYDMPLDMNDLYNIGMIDVVKNY